MVSKNKNSVKKKFFYWLTISNFLYIIVLLILAGVSIATLTGQNGVLTQANNAKIARAHGNVKDSMALAYNEYQLEKQTQNVGEIEKVASTRKVEIKGKEKNYLARLGTFLDFLLDKGYIESKKTGGVGDYPNGQEKILEITQWGETGLERVDLSYCTNLRKIASPSKNSFININPEYGFQGAFENCEKLTEIPADLFSNCPQITDFERTFYNCISLTKIPQTLFDNCQNVIGFTQTFDSCTNLTGDPIPLWKRVENGAENEYMGTPNGNACYYNCQKLNNYNNIPEYWRNRVR